MMSQSDNSSAKPMQEKSTRNLKAMLIVLAIVLAGAILRLYRLQDGLWLDEIYTYLNYARLPFLTIITKFDSENQHFLYSILAHASILLFGDNGWALRLPAVVFGTGSIVAMYLVGREVTDLEETILATALVAFSYHQIWFSQNARGYTGLLFWTLLSSWFLILGFKKNDYRYWLGYAISAALGMYTHLTMGFVIAGQFISFLIRLFDRKWQGRHAKWIAFLVGFGGAGLLTFLLYIPVLGDIQDAMRRTLTGVAEMWNSPLWTLNELFRGLSIGYSGGLIVLAALVVFIIGVIDYSRKNRIVVELLIFGPAIGALLTISLGHPLWPRFFFFAFGFVALVVIRGATRSVRLAGQLIHLNPVTIRRLEIIAGIILVVVSALSIPFAYGPKQDFAGARQFIEENWQAGDQAVTVSLTVVPYSQYIRTDWTPVDSLAALDAVRTHSLRTWLVYTFPQVLEVVSPEIMHTVNKDFSIQHEFGGTLAGGTIYVLLADNRGMSSKIRPSSP
jgi:mannosyltransferase